MFRKLFVPLVPTLVETSPASVSLSLSLSSGVATAKPLLLWASLRRPWTVRERRAWFPSNPDKFERGTGLWPCQGEFVNGEWSVAGRSSEGGLLMRHIARRSTLHPVACRQRNSSSAIFFCHLRTTLGLVLSWSRVPFHRCVSAFVVSCSRAYLLAVVML